jgi:hypothetical protein
MYTWAKIVNWVSSLDVLDVVAVIAFAQAICVIGVIIAIVFG